MLCEGEAYDGNAPTKQNLLCHGRAPIHVIREQLLVEAAAASSQGAVQNNADGESNNREEAILTGLK